ncbi:MAG: sulfite exporter TauE/SafE family protein [Candidatus Nanopelagicaceae bacterium]
MFEIVAIFVVGLSVGFLNGFAGGASILSFPALIAVGLNPVTAAMTNALGVSTANIGALFGKFKYVKDIVKAESVLIGYSMVGAVIGGLALALMPIEGFQKMVPILILIASLTLFIKVKENLTPLKQKIEYFWLTSIGFYAGYFGPGQGVMTIAVLARDAKRSVSDINISKNVVVTMTGLGSNFIYIVSGKVNWTFALVLAISCAIGGFFGAKVVDRFSREAYRMGIFVIGLLSAVWFATEYWF